MNAVVPTSFGDHIGLAVVRSLGKNKIPITVVSKDKNALPFYSKYCSNKIITEYNDDFLSTLTEDDIIIPNGEDEMLFFARNAPLYDYELAYPDISILEKIVDKSQLMQFAMSNNIPAPKTICVNSHEDIYEIQNILKFPVIIKPTNENSGKGIVRVDSPEMIEEIYERTQSLYGPPIIQEYIPHKRRYTVAALNSKDNSVLRICIIHDKRIYPLNTGPACFVETVENMEIMDLTCDIVKSLNLWGISELDFVIDERDEKPKLLEINPRFWGSVQCAISAGVDFPVLLYKMVTENNISFSLEHKTGITARYLFPQDLLCMIIVLRGNFPFNYKLKTIFDFVKIYQDDAYYIFSIPDLRPFLSIVEYYCSKIKNKVLLSNTMEISK